MLFFRDSHNIIRCGLSAQSDSFIMTLFEIQIDKNPFRRRQDKYNRLNL